MPFFVFSPLPFFPSLYFSVPSLRFLSPRAPNFFPLSLSLEFLFLRSGGTERSRSSISSFHGGVFLSYEEQGTLKKVKSLRHWSTSLAFLHVVKPEELARRQGLLGGICHGFLEIYVATTGWLIGPTLRDFFGDSSRFQTVNWTS